MLFNDPRILSYDPEARVAPSGENATEPTKDLCPSKVAILVCVAMSHSLTVLSSAPEARIVPSDENATEPTPFACSRVVMFRLVDTSHSQIVPTPAKLAPPHARVVPSGENIIEVI